MTSTSQVHDETEKEKEMLRSFPTPTVTPFSQAPQCIEYSDNMQDLHVMEFIEEKSGGKLDISRLKKFIMLPEGVHTTVFENYLRGSGTYTCLYMTIK
jgi:hypothetical protein